MSALEPIGASHPTLDDVYKAPGNPAETSPAEQAAKAKNAKSNSGQAVDRRIPATQSTSSDDATPSSLGRGIHDAPPGEEAQGKTDEDVGRSNELDGEQMAAPGEGRVADVVDKKPGATGGEKELTGDLERKKAEQAGKREEVKEGRRAEVDVKGVLENRGAPASA